MQRKETNMTAVDVQAESTAERRLSEQVRRAALSEIEARSLSDEELAPILGLSQTVLYLLSLRESWPLSLSVHVAEALGLHVDITISANGGGASPEARAA